MSNRYKTSLSESPILISNIVAITGRLGDRHMVLDVVLNQKFDFERLEVDCRMHSRRRRPTSELDNLAMSGYIDSIDE